MLRRSTSFDTRPMPMNTAMNSPNAAVAASPRSLMIFTSWPAVSWPMRYEEEISSTANSTRLYGTRSRTDSLKTLTATQLIARMGSCRGAARAIPNLGHTAHEEVLQRVANRVQRDERRPGRRKIGQQPFGRLRQRHFERVALLRDLR